LSDFRVEHEKFLDDQLTHSVATLMAEGLVEMERVAVDGVRVRASAGSGSFHREKSLKESLKMAQEQVEALKKELREEPGAGMRRKEAAQKRVAEQRVKRIEAALKKHEKLKEEKKGKEEKEPRVSTTDAEARVMKMADGGFRPAYNVQMGTDTKSQIILGVEVLTRGSDRGEGGPMVGQLEKRYGRKPKDVLVDGGYVQNKDFEEMGDKGCRVYAPVKKPKEEGRNPYEPLWTDGLVIEEWKRRMGTPEAKEIYKQRASTAECVNAIARNRGLQQFLVRGVEKVRCVALWLALAHNVMRTLYLRKVATEGI
jgi:hypothetical protein